MMSWWAVNIVLAIQVGIIVLMLLHVKEALRIISSLRAWALQLPEDMVTTVDRISATLNMSRHMIYQLLRQTKFVMVCATLVVVANIFQHPIVYLPFWASIGFTLEIIWRITNIYAVGQYLNDLTRQAKQEVEDGFLNAAQTAFEDLDLNKSDENNA